MAILLTNETFARIMKVVEAYEAGTFKKTTNVYATGMDFIPSYCVQLANNLDAADGVGGVTKSEDAKLYKITGTSTKTLEDTTLTEDVFNYTTTKFLSDAFIPVVREPASGCLCAVASGGATEAREGILAQALTPLGGANVNQWDCNGDPTGNLFNVVDKAGWSGDIGKYVLAIKVCDNWRPVVVGC